MTSHKRRRFSLLPSRPPAVGRGTVRRRILAAAAIACAIGAWNGLVADDACAAIEPGESRMARFYEQDPFDVVRLQDAANTEIKTITLDLPDHKVPLRPLPTDKLLLRRFESPDEQFEVEWQAIAEVKLFEQMVLEEANKLVASGDFNEAYEYFAYLNREYPKVAGLAEAISAFIYEEAKQWQRAREYDHALALLNTLYDRQPSRPGLEAAIGAATGKLIDSYLAADDFPSARRLLKDLRGKYPESAASKRYRQQIVGRAEALLAEATRQLEAGQPEQALAQIRQGLLIWPTLEGARELAQRAFQADPRLIVAVTLPVRRQAEAAFYDWPARRGARLFERTLIEFAGYGPAGGEYSSPYGRYELADLGRRISLEIKPGIPWIGGSDLTGQWLARRLLALGDRGQAGFEQDWADVCQSIDVHGLYHVDIYLRAAHVQPVALLQIPIAAAGSAVSPSTPYQMPDAPAGTDTTFAANPGYFARLETEPPRITERVFPDIAAATTALVRGEVALLDQVAPWDVARLKAAGQLVVEPYSVPAVHCLLPNLSRPFTGNRTFRRALLYGINRPMILREHLLQRQAVAGCEVVSGPFAKGTGLSDPLGYAYNEDLAPRPYEPRVAMTLATAALREVRIAAKRRGEELEGFAPLVLAHPADDVARTAVQAIAKDLEAIKLEVELREIPANQPPALAPDVDLLYVALRIEEPVVQARRLLGEAGLVGVSSSYMSLALRQVETAGGWNEARAALHDVHRIAYDDVSVLPLWQLIEHLAYHESLTGVGTKPATLYQRVEQWQPAVTLPVEVP